MRRNVTGVSDHSRLMHNTHCFFPRLTISPLDSGHPPGAHRLPRCYPGPGGRGSPASSQTSTAITSSINSSSPGTYPNATVRIIHCMVTCSPDAGARRFGSVALTPHRREFHPSVVHCTLGSADALPPSLLNSQQHELMSPPFTVTVQLEFRVLSVGRNVSGSDVGPF